MHPALRDLAELVPEYRAGDLARAVEDDPVPLPVTAPSIDPPARVRRSDPVRFAQMLERHNGARS